MSQRRQYTPALRRIATLCGASWPYEQAEKVIRELTGVELSHKTIQNLCESEADRIEAENQETYETLENQALVETMESLVGYLAQEDDCYGETKPETEVKDNSTAKPKTPPARERLYMGMDGVYIGEVRRKKHIEAKVGIVFTDERATISKNRNLLLNKQYVGTFHPSSQFSEKLFCCAKEMGLGKETELIILGDGARWIRKIAEIQYPKATLTLDWWHLKEHVWETVGWLKANYLGDLQAKKWGRRLIGLLWRGKAIPALKWIKRLGESLSIVFPETAKERRQLDERSLPLLYQYIKNNHNSIVDYRARKEAGYFISSVFAEKAVDVLVCRRQKCRGMNWSRDGAENIIILRQLILNDKWEDHWQTQKAA